jgi:hypothetical protein
MIRLAGDGTYRGPGGPDPQKTRQEREQELRTIANTKDGKNIIYSLWLEARGVPPGEDPQDAIGTLLRQEMIPEILKHEYPNG